MGGLETELGDEEGLCNLNIFQMCMNFQRMKWFKHFMEDWGDSK